MHKPTTQINIEHEETVSPTHLANPLMIENLTKQYAGRPVPAIDKISFTIRRGEFHAFIGANGAGKTTSIKSIVGAYARYEGSIKIFGHKNTSKEAKANLGYIPEKADFPTSMSLAVYLICMAKLSGKTRKESKVLVAGILKTLGMQKVAKKSPNGFSSGQKKKVLLAQALLHNPKLLVMDEPAANLDPKARMDFFDSLKVLQKKGVSIMISSHILAELTKYADSVTIIDGGKVVLSGNLKELAARDGARYEIGASDGKVLNHVLRSYGIHFKPTEGGHVIAELPAQDDWFKIQRQLTDRKVSVRYFMPLATDLESLYREYVIKGSVDTGIGATA
ncbi:unnamed protein product [Didymodactylos carnosus]|uniref:ABC transporter domain-containing protein n=1 Tax=Didymodactylos carnosus TaxID=1234261 RepID=A0A8S2H1M7_9BILA|nr:unnamed protein product [Didymodactylos carnosus]CAF3581305.1 unnamed protein product [Didymodactylos carnosus]